MAFLISAPQEAHAVLPYQVVGIIEKNIQKLSTLSDHWLTGSGNPGCFTSSGKRDPILCHSII